MSIRAIGRVNRFGVPYYLHGGTTKSGKPRYYAAKKVGEEALAAMPAGYEFCESVNGVVSVRRIPEGAPAVPPPDLALVRAGLARQPHLARHRADVVKGEMVVFEPQSSRYTPVMKFVPSEGGYSVHRMTYRGHGGWSWPLAHGGLIALLAKYIPLIGTERFFDLA